MFFLFRILAALALMLSLSSCQSAHQIKAHAIGQTLDNSLSLLDIDQKPYTLSELASGKKGTVIFFWQRLCPCVKRYQQRIEKLFSAYGKDLAFINVSSNSNESFEEVLKEYYRRSISLPLLRDERGKLAQAMNVRGTPSAALLSPEGTIAFIGWIDNERDTKEPGRMAYLENAVKQYLAGIPISVAQTPMFGCVIR